MVKKLICIQCPLGCEIEVKLNEKMEVEEIKGNRCPRGYEYAMEEMVDPKRILTTSVKVEGGDIDLVSVKTDKPIPKRLLKDAMKTIKKDKVKEPICVGDIILPNLLNTEANVVATRPVSSRDSNHEATKNKRKKCNTMQN